jgi:glycosyltransferase 2 family protein
VTQTRRSRRLGPALSVVVIAALLWWFFRGVSFAELVAEIRRADASYIASAVVLSLYGFLFRIVRWRYLLAPLMWVGLRSLAAAVFVGWAVTAILPGRVGEIARAVLLREREGVRASAALGTLERMMDALAILILVAASIGFVPAASLGSAQASLMSTIRTGGLIVFGVLTASMILILLMHRVPAVVIATLRRWAERLPGVAGTAAWGMIEAFGAGLSGAVRGGSRATGITPSRVRLAVTLHSAALWMVICGVHVLLLRAFAIDASVFVVPPLLFLITVGLMVPVPGSVGSYHKAVQLGLTAMLGVSNETAAGYAVVSHAVTLGPPTVIGLIVLAREGLTLSALASWRDAAQAPVE